MGVIERTDRTIDLSGIDDHTVANLPLVTAGAVVDTDRGPILLVVHQAADMTNSSKTILSAAQLEHFGCDVYDKSPHVTHFQPFLSLPGGYRVPIAIRKGLPYIRMRKFRGATELNSLTHVPITSPAEWDPGILDAPVLASWFTDAPPHLLAPTLVTPDGALAPHPEHDDEDEDFSDRKH